MDKGPEELSEEDQAFNDTMGIKNFEGGYNRRGMIWVEKEECDVCHQNVLCLCIDQSEDEYEAGHVCQQCTNNLFERAK